MLQTAIQKQEKSVEKVIEDLQPPPKPKIIQYKLWEVKCLDCGHKSLSKDRDCPQKNTGFLGCFRSEKGAENYQYIASLPATWRLQGKNGFEELEGLLRQELCLS